MTLTKSTQITAADQKWTNPWVISTDVFITNSHIFNITAPPMRNVRKDVFCRQSWVSSTARSTIVRHNFANTVEPLNRNRVCQCLPMTGNTAGWQHNSAAQTTNKCYTYIYASFRLYLKLYFIPYQWYIRLHLAASAANLSTNNICKSYYSHPQDWLISSTIWTLIISQSQCLQNIVLSK